MLQDGLVYSESRMATVEEYISDLVAFEMNDSSAGKGGPVLYHKNGKIYADPGEGHSIIVGDTGSGKTQMCVLPLIFSSIKAHESILVVDPKGELYRRSQYYLELNGYDLHAVNFRNPDISRDKWNPFGRVAEFYNKGNAVKAQYEQGNVIQRLFNERSSADKDAYWNESSGMFAEGSIELSHLIGEEISIENLMKWRYERLSDGTMETYYKTLPKDSKAYRNLAGFFSLTAENTKTCILSTYDQLIRLFNSADGLTKMLSESTFDMASAGVKPTAVFLIVPDEKTVYHFLASLFVNQSYEALLELAEKHNGRLPVRVNYIMEEFCNMPMIPDFGPMLSAARSRNIRIHLVCQAYSQLVDKYGDNMAKTILANCSNLMYLHSRERKFLEYLSKLAGSNEYNRPLLSTSRLQRLQKNEMLVFHERCYPYIVRNLPKMYQYEIYNKYMSDEALKRYEKKKYSEKGIRESTRMKRK